jgi:hypothetical protein
MSARDIERAQGQHPVRRGKQASAIRKLIGIEANTRFGRMVQAALGAFDRLDGFVNDGAIFLDGMLCRVTAKSHRNPSVRPIEQQHIASAKHSRTVSRW